MYNQFMQAVLTTVFVIAAAMYIAWSLGRAVFAKQTTSGCGHGCGSCAKENEPVPDTNNKRLNLL